MERGLLCLLVLYLGFVTVPRACRTLHSDFTNYYMTARLAHEGYEMSRVYEWGWIQREKDHRAVDVRVLGMGAITPFSTLAMWPLTRLGPLTAKQLWVLLNLVLVAPLLWMLRSMTGLSYQRTLLAVLVIFPFHRNLVEGQMYFVLLLLIAASCWAWLRGHSGTAGALLAIAAACKVFPLLLFFFFLQRRDYRALISGALTGLATLGTSVAIFGWNLHRTYLHEILPWTLRGEGMPPYETSAASISSVLHYLLLKEPQWNPYPWHNSPLAFSLLISVLPMLALAPAILLIRRDDKSTGQVLLEWSALLTAALTVSTVPASYHFVLMIFPVCVLATQLMEREWYGWLAGLLIAYLGIGFPMSSPSKMIGLGILLYVPRLPLVLAVLAGTYGLLWRSRKKKWEWTQYAWAALMLAAAVAGAISTLGRERGMREEYAYRLIGGPQSLLSITPKRTGTGEDVRYIALDRAGYHLVEEGWNFALADNSTSDVLSFDGNVSQIWVENALAPQSKIADRQDLSHTVVVDGRDPMVSADDKDLAFVRDDHGHGQLMVSRGFEDSGRTEAALTPASLNVYEATFHSGSDYAFSAVEAGQPPQVYLSDASHSNVALGLGESRYPALSPDGRWLAYSRLDSGVWNLWVRDQRTGGSSRVADVPCDQIQPSWESDSKTLLYATDCGRSLWFTGVARRQVIP